MYILKHLINEESCMHHSIFLRKKSYVNNQPMKWLLIICLLEKVNISKSSSVLKILISIEAESIMNNIEICIIE